MQTWHQLNLGDAMLADSALLAVMAALRESTGPSPLGTAPLAYTSHESEGRLHCELLVYFPPTSTELARRCGGTACPAPSTDALQQMNRLA